MNTRWVPVLLLIACSSWYMNGAKPHSAWQNWESRVFHRPSQLETTPVDHPAAFATFSTTASV